MQITDDEKNISTNDPEMTGTVKRFVCQVCGYVYEAEAVPEEFSCPLCGIGAGFFVEE